MFAASAGRPGRSASAVIAVLIASAFFGLTVAARGLEKDNGIQPASAQTLSNLPAFLAEHYPTVRALVLARGDCTIFEYYRKDVTAETRSPMYSVTKSVLSILVGIAIDEGYLRLDEKLSEIIPEVFDASVDPLVREITVRDLLTKTEGFAETTPGDFKLKAGASEIWPWMLYRPVKYQPGTHFRYDLVGSDLLSLVLSKAIREDGQAFARQRLLGPLQIGNYNWDSFAEGYLHGEKGLLLTARDMAKIGLLYLHNGKWGDRQIVSEQYVADSTTKHNDGGPPTHAAYGYQWWVGKTKIGLDAFFAAGFRSQLIYVVPKLDLVLAVAAESIPGGSQKFINDVVLPADASFSDASSCVAEVGQASPR